MGTVRPSSRAARGAVAAVVLLLGLALAAGVVGPRLVGAQGTPAAGAAGATLRVAGSGTVALPPDTASVNVGVDVTEPALADAQAAASERMAAILAAVEAAGIAEEDVQTVSYSVNPIRAYDDTGNPGEITGFGVSNQVSVQVRDLGAVSDLLAEVVAAGANNVFGVSFYLADPSGAAADARERAVADARDRAEGLAAAAGRSVGEIVAIAETVSAPGFYAAGDTGQRAGGGPPVQPGTTGVTVHVEVTYELT